MSTMLGASSRIAWGTTSSTLAIKVNKGWVVVGIAISVRLMRRQMGIEVKADEELVVVTSYMYSCRFGVEKPEVECLLYLEG